MQASPRKKKKKKPKKKKKATSLDSPPASPSPSALSMESVASAAAKMNLSEHTSPKKSGSTSSVDSSLKASLPKSAAFYSPSTTSLGIGETTTAQSSHSYLQTLNIKTEKKIKTRPDHASLFSNDGDEKRGLFSKISSKVASKDKESEMKEAKQSWFSKLSKKTTGYMHQLLKTGEDAGADGKGTMKWEQFLKVG